MKKYKINNVKKHFNISKEQFLNIYQQMDTGGPYNDFNEMYMDFNKAVGTRAHIKISKIKYKKTILLLLSYYKNIIIFE